MIIFIKLAKVDKFKYLKGLLEEPARGVIAGFALTEADYDSAVELLRNRFAKPTILQRAHVQELLSLQPLYSDRSFGKLRSMHDAMETHYRGLEALGVNQNTYSSIVVPALLNKLPESCKLNMVRFGENHLEWTLEDMLKSFAKELEIRESFVSMVKTPQPV
eukprot:gene17840-biopygen6664